MEWVGVGDTELARRSGVTRQTIYNLREAKGGVTQATLNALAKALGVAVPRIGLVFDHIDGTDTDAQLRADAAAELRLLAQRLEDARRLFPAADPAGSPAVPAPHESAAEPPSRRRRSSGR